MVTDETFLPWWMVLLLGLWATALTVWQQSPLRRDNRLLAAAFSLLYVGLICIALGLPRLFHLREPSATSTLTLLMSLGFGAVSMLAATIMLGPVSTEARQFCFAVLTASNGAFCLSIGARDSAICLFLVALISIVRLAVQIRRSTARGSSSIWTLLTCMQVPTTVEDRGRSVLVGALNASLALLLIGTVAFSTRVETHRANTSRRTTALPSQRFRERIAVQQKTTAGSSALNLALDHRSELFVMLGLICFLALARSSPLRGVTDRILPQPHPDKISPQTFNDPH